MTAEEIKGNTSESTSCHTCGGSMTYKPNAAALVCKYCGTEKQLKKEESTLNELDFLHFAQRFQGENYPITKVIICSKCQAKSIAPEIIKSMACLYCKSPLVEKDIHEERYIHPQYIAPFDFEEDQAKAIFNHWIKNLPNLPKKMKRGRLTTQKITGVYVPFWTYDMHASSEFTGERGLVYYETIGDNNNKREVRRVAWTHVKGNFFNFYDDILIAGTKSLKSDLVLQLSSFWNLKKLQPIQPDYLTGFITEKYQIDLQNAFSQAKSSVTYSQRDLAERQIGGDEQRIYQVDTTLSNITFKHILLPLYVSYFTYKNKHYSFYINGVNGKIVGEYPQSKLKLIIAHIITSIIMGLIIWFIVYVFINLNNK
ncbi:hypothetical protein [Myroides odoratus]|uniref:hypothetical protein n=1 Tax=Myroides odoratus TaxID=256 RepID=UPI00333EBD2B